MEHTYSNRLVHETSPYLLQHAHNPVDWYPWGDEALNIAKKTGRPILVSIGYAACHWCHVMERESFEDPETAAFMNEHFVNIKIDREERPDLDMIYMDAVQAMTGSGGWPLNVFLNTEAIPFYGGTYFPPARAHNRSSWSEVLHFIHNAWTNRREELEKQAAELARHLAHGEKIFIKNITLPAENEQPVFSKESCDDIAKKLLKNADEEDGGFGAAPKFPQFFSIQFLMQYGHFFKQEKALEHALFSLKKMLKGGIYDQLAGGLSRYSTVSNWLVPHFEKMLYDNALLVMTLSDAYQLTGDSFFSDAIRKTIDFFIHEMKNEEGGFYAALDADSEGEEGKFYVWDKREVEDLLAADADLYGKWYGISAHGNWEGKNILHISENEDEFATGNGITVQELHNLLNQGNAILLKQRNQRQRPLTDDKIILGWNALFLAALCKASSALGDKRYRDEAVELFTFIRKKFCEDDMIRFHVYKNGISKHPAFLDDYAYLVKACILLQELTGERDYLLYARKLTDYVIDHFENMETGFFYYTHSGQTDIITRKAEFYDGALPSANSVMTENLFYLSAVFNTGEWQTKADQILFNIKEVAIKYPASFSVWSILMLHRVTGVNEIIITGKNGQEIHEGILKLFIPNKLLMAAQEEEPGFPLLEGKSYTHIPLVYLCKNNSCQAPVESIKSLTLLLKNNHY